VGAVDCTEADAGALCAAAHVAAYPTLHLYAGGAAHSHFQYTGERSVAALSAFLVRALQAGDALVTAPDAAHAALAGHADETPAEAARHAAARDRLAALMAAPADAEAASDAADPGPAMELIERLHAAGIAAPGDAARARLLADARPADGAADGAAGSDGAAGGGGGGSAAAGGAAGAAAEPPLRPGACNVVGDLSVPRVPGAIRFRVAAAGVSVDAARVNVTHTVHALWFGDARLTAYQARRVAAALTAADLERLSGTRHVARAPRASLAHYLAVVPHDVRFSTGHAVRAHAYTAQSAASEAVPGAGAGADAAPTASFAYEISPLAVTIAERRLPLWRLGVNVAAIVGGITAFLSVLDSLLHGVAALASKKKG
jgi:hypothetical protein